MAQAYLSLGSNLNNRQGNLRFAIENLNQLAGNVFLESSVYETAPWGFVSKNLFLNQIVGLETNLDPLLLLEILQEIESRCGRIRKPGPYLNRELDIDIVFYEQIQLDTLRLRVPHPRMHERLFVLLPLNEIAPNYFHPKLHKSVSELLKICTDKSEIRPYR